MRYVIVDLDGASRDYFGTVDAVGSALRAAERDMAGTAAEFYVVAYDDGGRRVGDPVRGDEWLRALYRAHVMTGASRSTRLVEPTRSSETVAAGVSTGSLGAPA